MSLRGIRGTLNSFIAHGGHIWVGISRALGASDAAIASYIRRHIVDPVLGDYSTLNNIADEGIRASIINNSLEPSEVIDLGNVPIVPDQYGDDANGRRITTAVIVGETEDDPGKLISLDFEDSYTRSDMESLLEAILQQWQGDSPEAFTGDLASKLRTEAIREIYTSRKF